MIGTAEDRAEAETVHSPSGATTSERERLSAVDQRNLATLGLAIGLLLVAIQLCLLTSPSISTGKMNVAGRSASPSPRGASSSEAWGCCGCSTASRAAGIEEPARSGASGTPSEG